MMFDAVIGADLIGGMGTLGERSPVVSKDFSDRERGCVDQVHEKASDGG